jgi:TonB family protein
MFAVSLLGEVRAADLAQKLNAKYKDQVLSLRHPSPSRAQDYASDGSPVKAGNEGPWTLYGRVRIDKIGVDRNTLQAKATRLSCTFDKDGLKQSRKGEHITIRIRLDHPLASEDEAAALFGRVFALTDEEIVRSMPDYWRDYLAKNMFGPPHPEARGGLVANRNQRKSDPATAADAKEDADPDKVFHVGLPKVQAPKPQYAPEPEFTEAARKARYQGVVGMNVVVGKDGLIKNPRIVHPLGMGLDENAIATVRQWRFAPGTMDGRPVNVAVYIEVDYHLY